MRRTAAPHLRTKLTVSSPRRPHMTSCAAIQSVASNDGDSFSSTHGAQNSYNRGAFGERRRRGSEDKYVLRRDTSFTCGNWLFSRASDRGLPSTHTLTRGLSHKARIEPEPDIETQQDSESGSDQTNKGTKSSVAEMLARRRERQWFIIDPRKSRRGIPAWDFTTALCLMYTALFTPFEVSFLDPPSTWEEAGRDPFFVINRLIDLVFVADIVLQARGAK